MTNQAIANSLKLYGPSASRTEIPFNCSHDGAAHKQEIASALAARVETLFSSRTFMDRIRGSIPSGINHSDVQLQFNVDSQGLSVDVMHGEQSLGRRTYTITGGFHSPAASSDSRLLELPEEADIKLASISPLMIDEANAIFRRCTGAHHHAAHTSSFDPWGSHSVAPMSSSHASHTTSHSPSFASYPTASSSGTLSSSPLPAHPSFYPHPADNPIHEARRTLHSPSQPDESARQFAPLRAQVHQIGVRIAALSTSSGSGHLPHLAPIDTTTATPQELAQYLERASIYLGDVQDQIQATRDNHHHDRMESEQTLQGLRALNQQLQTANAELERALGASQASLLANQAATVQTLNALSAQLESMQAEHTAALGSARQRYQGELTRLTDQYEARLRGQQEGHEQQLALFTQQNAQLKAQFDEALAALTQHFERAKQELETNYNSRLRALEEQNSSLQRRNQELEAQLESMRTEHAAALLQLQREHQAELNALKGQHHRELGTQQERYDKEVNRLTSQNEQGRNTYTLAVEALKEQYTRQVAALNERLERSTAKMEEIERLLSSIEGSLDLPHSGSSSNPSLENRLERAQARLIAIDEALKARKNEPRKIKIHHNESTTIPATVRSSEESIRHIASFGGETLQELPAPPAQRAETLASEKVLSAAITLTTSTEVIQRKTREAVPFSGTTLVELPTENAEDKALADDIEQLNQKISDLQHNENVLDRLALSDREKTEYFLENLYFSQVEDMRMDGANLIVTLSPELAFQLGLGQGRRTITVHEKGSISTGPRSFLQESTVRQHFYQKLIKLRTDTRKKLNEVRLLEDKGATPWANWGKENFKPLMSLLNDLSSQIAPHLSILSNDLAQEADKTSSIGALKQMARIKTTKDGASRFTGSPMVNYWHLWLLLHSKITIRTSSGLAGRRSAPNGNITTEEIIAKDYEKLFEGLVVSKSSKPPLLPAFKQTFKHVFELFSPTKLPESLPPPPASSSSSSASEPSVEVSAPKPKPTTQKKRSFFGTSGIKRGTRTAAGSSK